MKRRAIAATLAVVASAMTAPAAATDTSQRGWLAWFNTVSLDPGRSIISDVQLRSRDALDGAQTLLLRAGLNHAVGTRHNVAVGAAYIGNDARGGDRLSEFRLWQQWVIAQPLGNTALSHRFRFEQRWLEQPGNRNVDSLRLRYFARAVHRDLPDWLTASVGADYLAGQNEIFLNLTARDELNGEVFDQNRLYGGLGWQLSERIDLEVGYLNLFVRGRAEDAEAHILQLSLFTR